MKKEHFKKECPNSSDLTTEDIFVQPLWPLLHEMTKLTPKMHGSQGRICCTVPLQRSSLK